MEYASPCITQATSIFSEIFVTVNTGMNATILRPWGWFSDIHSNRDVSIKEIKLKSEGGTELTRHPNYQTSWLVVYGRCVIITDDVEVTLDQYSHYLLATDVWFKISNPSDDECKLLEFTWPL